MATKNAKRVAFIAALTSTDQLAPTERKRHAEAARRTANETLRQERYEAWMMGEVAFHRAAAASRHACCARILHWDDAKLLSDEADYAVRDLIKATDRLMVLPIRNKDDRKERGVLLRKWGNASTFTGYSRLWEAAAQKWVALLDATNTAEG